MNRLAPVVLLCVLLSCKSKEKKADVPADSFFPVAEYIRGELARLDTTKATITKIETVNGRPDTATIAHADVRRYAADFLNLPDLSSPDIKNDYEVTHLYDDLQEAFVFTYTTRENHPVQQQDVTVEPQLNASGKNDIESVYTKLIKDSAGTVTSKMLLWTAGKSFMVTTVTQPPAGPEQIRKLQVVWNGFNGTDLQK